MSGKRRLTSQGPASGGPSAAPARAELVGGRYELLQPLGEGGMGVVHLARDYDSGEVVALKRLQRVDAKSVLRFKREFRALADMNHPNLVRLYDLQHAADGAWLLAMEYVDGCDLVADLGRQQEPRDRAAHLQRVCSSFGQLAHGIGALHCAGMLHRDLKPSNVLVQRERVIVLDFGLVRELDARAVNLTQDDTVSGTPAYMAPEQALGHELDEAADWYAFGVMLYEVLAGVLPFDGKLMELMQRKLDSDPVALRALEPDVPAPLEALCMALLQREPARRPAGPEIVACLQRVAPPASTARGVEQDSSSTTDAAQAPRATFVGRDQQLQMLWDALDEAERGTTVVVHVCGMSGAGKSALVEEFLDRVFRRASVRGDRALVLRSRCYEREAMPFKALDGIIDALVMYLAQCDDFEVGHLLPTDVQVLAQLFPALERVRAVKKLMSLQRSGVQARSERQRAEAALRELWTRLARSRPLVVWVDDLQWGDLDSASILRGWLEQPAHVPVLLVLSYRADEVDTSPVLRLLLADDRVASASCVQRSVNVGELEPGDVRALCVERLGMRGLGRGELIEHIVREARGSPFLAAQLTSLALARIERGDLELQALSLDAVIAQTRALLQPEAASLLTVLAVAGRPMAPKLALRAAGVKRGGRGAVHSLRSLNLVRTRDADLERLLEVYHDRIREAVCAALGPEALRTTHNALLRALEHSGRADADWLHTLALGTGDKALALHYGVAAAERARGTLAFERAAELYERCLELVEPSAPELGDLWRNLGHMLANCGRGVKAASALLEAIKYVPGAEQTELKRLAASHLVRSGQFERGEQLTLEAMDALGIDVPRTEGRLLAAVAWERMRVRLRGTSFKLRAAGATDAAQLARIDLFETLRVTDVGLATLRSLLFHSRGFVLALDAGEPARIARALSGEAAIRAATAEPLRSQRSSDALFARAQRLVDELNQPRVAMELAAARTVSYFYSGRMRDVVDSAEEFERLDRESPPQSAEADYYVRFGVLSARVGALAALHECPRFLAELRALLQEAQATSNVNALLSLALNQTIADEFTGQPQASIERLEAQRPLLPKHCYSVLHVLHLIAVMRAASATRRHSWGLAYVQQQWPAYERSAVHHTRFLRVLAHSARARLLLNQYLVEPDPQLLRQFERDLKILLPMPASGGLRLRARLLHLHGDDATALSCLRQSVDELDAAGYPGEAARDRWALGKLLGGDEGKRLVSRAQAVLAQTGAADPLRDTYSHYPELAALD